MLITILCYALGYFIGITFVIYSVQGIESVKDFYRFIFRLGIESVKDFYKFIFRQGK